MEVPNTFSDMGGAASVGRIPCVPFGQEAGGGGCMESVQLEGSPRLAGSSRGCRGSADSEFTWLPRFHLGPIWLCLGSI